MLQVTWPRHGLSCSTTMRCGGSRVTIRPVPCSSPPAPGPMGNSKRTTAPGTRVSQSAPKNQPAAASWPKTSKIASGVARISCSSTTTSAPTPICSLGRCLFLRPVLDQALNFGQRATVQGNEELHHPVHGLPLEGVEAVAAVPSLLHHFGGAKDPQVGRHPRPAHGPHLGGDLTHRTLPAVGQDAQDRPTSGVSERPERQVASWSHSLPRSSR